MQAGQSFVVVVNDVKQASTLGVIARINGSIHAVFRQTGASHANISLIEACSPHIGAE